MKRLIILLFLFLIPNIGNAQESVNSVKPDKYDTIFKDLTFENDELFWVDVKALCLVETTTLSNTATSSKNAKGVCQILPATFKEVVKQTKRKNYHIRNPEHNIRIAAKYLEILYRRWGESMQNVESDEGEEDQLKLALASYNAGYGRVRKAMRKCNGTNFNTIKRCLPSQTVAYVRKVNIQRAELYSIDV